VAATGWAPYHLTLSQESGDIVGAVAMYLKNHSQGEYVFDYSWADAFERAGGQYYPKLQISVPFTPATGRRILTKTDTGDPDIDKYLISGMMQVAEQMEVSSVHVTFADKAQWEAMGGLGFLQRTHNQFHWQNHGYKTFDDFLGDLSSKKRKNIRRERRGAIENDIEIERLTGTQITEAHWDAFYRFYVDTGSRKWGSPYLTRQFFSLIGESMPNDILLIMCKRAGRYIAGAINFIGGECLFGRNWGCIEDHRFLHFETCYYQAIEFAIERGLSRVEAGAQGQHKLARGYMPTTTYSAHWIANASFRDAIDNYLSDERRHVEEEIDYIGEHSPFRKSVQ
jgi:predicted N-acyltransferase